MKFLKVQKNVSKSPTHQDALCRVRTPKTYKTPSENTLKIGSRQQSLIVTPTSIGPFCFGIPYKSRHFLIKGQFFNWGLGGETSG